MAQLLRDSLGNISCRTCMIAHVSEAVPHYNESLQVVQLAARIHRMRRRKIKVGCQNYKSSIPYRVFGDCEHTNYIKTAFLIAKNIFDGQNHDRRTEI